MKIRIDQTLHGYNHGHQLLSSSISLTSEVKEVLLVHSDLSGSSIDNGFKEYITGYPLPNNKYALAKTWYAEEMKRPGCVWTHTLLIDFADLGKIPDLEKLTTIFSRPSINEYLNYQLNIDIDAIDFLDTSVLLRNIVSDRIMSALYEDYDCSVLLPSESSLKYEKMVLQIWSNQWPRLRRNFTFCTGALNFKFLDGKEFDLQIVPDRNIDVIAKKSKKPIIVESNIAVDAEWLDIVYFSSKNEFRRFLWIYGSDVTGTRRYFKPLALLYRESLTRDKSIVYIADLVESSFTDIKEADLLKTKIFSADNIFKFEESVMLNYLLTSEVIPISDYEKLGIESRLIEAYRSKKISFEKLIELFVDAKPGRISKDIWNNVNLSESEILLLVSRDNSLLALFSNKILILAEQRFVWEKSVEFQERLNEFLENQNCNWRAILFAALEANSPIVIKMLDKDGNSKVRFVFEWQLLNNLILPYELGGRIFINFKSEFFRFINLNIANLSPAQCFEIFNYYNPNEIQAINISSFSWISIYSKISDDRLKIYASCVLLAMGFNKNVTRPELLIPVCFEDVFTFAKKSMLHGELWRILPIDLSEEEDHDSNPFSIIINLFNFSPKMISQVQPWDYCELLIRTLSNKFIKNNWPLQLYINSLSTREILVRSIEYCTSFKNGMRFLSRLSDGISKGGLTLSNAQREDINRLMKF